MTDDLAPWRSPLSHALHRHRSLPQSRYVQLSTVQPNGRPANRTLVFRGFLDRTNHLKFVTDARTPKAAQMSQNPWGELCWYFPESREQFRLAGELTLVEEGEVDPALQKARCQAWQDLSDAARVQFAWPPSGEPRDLEPEAFHPAAPAPDQPLPHFCLLLLDPESVDHLELRGDPQNRTVYQRQSDQTWTQLAVNP